MTEQVSKRQQCHNLVDVLPESALDETLEMLAEHLKFYKDQDQIKKNPLPPPVVRRFKLIPIEGVTER